LNAHFGGLAQKREWVQDHRLSTKYKILVIDDNESQVMLVDFNPVRF
jgi:hypothetical protein